VGPFFHTAQGTKVRGGTHPTEIIGGFGIKVAWVAWTG
jgi:hypothetical protein